MTPSNLTKTAAGSYVHANGTQVVKKARTSNGRNGYRLAGWALVVAGREVGRFPTLARAAQELPA